MTFENILAFCILMGNEKILTKSPDYIMEKYRRYCQSLDIDAFMNGLDVSNRQIFDEYKERWMDK